MNIDINLVNKIINGNKEAEKCLEAIISSRTKSDKQNIMCVIDSFDLKGENFVKFFENYCNKKIKDMETLFKKMIDKNITKHELLEVIENDLEINI